MKKIIYLLLVSVFVFAQATAQENQQKKLQNDQKYVVLEELTGTWCHYCPKGTIVGRELSQDYSNIIFVAIHTSDPMENSEYSSASGLTGAPTANVNRKVMGSSPEEWESKSLQEMGIDPPAYITVETNYNENSRELEAIISAEFIEDFSGELRLSGIVIEDAVTGPSPDYDQSNHYSGSGTSVGGFENLPSSVPASMIAYDHVGRHLLGGYEGVAGSIPSTVSAGEIHSYTFNYTIPEEYDFNNIRVAGLLINSGNGQVINAGKSSYIPGYDNGKPHFINAPITSGFVGVEYTYQMFTADPDNDNLTISAVDVPEWLTIAQGTQCAVHTEAVLSGTPTQAGVFPITLSVTDGDWTVEQNFDLIIGGNPGADWEIIGDEGFSAIESNSNVLSISADDVPYVAYKSYGSPIYVEKYSSSSWESVGANIGTAESDMDMVVNSNGNPCVAFNDVSQGGKCIVKMFDGSDWITLGDPVSVGMARNVAIATDNNGVLYTAFTEQSLGYAGFVYKFVNDSWEMVGDGQIDPSVALFFELAFDSQNTPYLLWCYSPSGYSFYSRVSKFDGGTWSVLAGGNIADEITYYRHHIAIPSDDKVYVSISETTSTLLNIYQLNNDEWSNISPSSGLVGEYHDILIDEDDNLILGFQNSSQGSQTSVTKYDGNIWESVGAIVISGAATNQSMAINSENEPYIAYTDSNLGDKTTVKAYLSSDVAVLYLSANFIEFSDTFIDVVSEETITISNSGNATLEVTNIVSDNDAFTLNLDSFTLEPAGSIELVVSFLPLLVQDYEGVISMSTNDPNQSSVEISVSGKGVLNTNVENLSSELLSIYPQPASNFLTLQSDAQIENIRIYNLKGQEVLSFENRSATNTLDISKLNYGLYMMKIELNNQIVVKKIIVQ